MGNGKVQGYTQKHAREPPFVEGSLLFFCTLLFPLMRVLPGWLWRTEATMAAARKPCADSVMEGHDGGPESEVRKKAAFESR